MDRSQPHSLPRNVRRILLPLILVAALMHIATSFAFAEPEEVWNRTYGGPYCDVGWQVQPTFDGGYVVVGHTSSGGRKADIWLLKVDSNGTVDWERTYGGFGEDLGYSVCQTSDGGYVVAGSTDSYGVGGEKLWLLKVDNTGAQVWDRVLGGFVSSEGDGGWYVKEAPGGGYLLTGYTRSKGAGGKDLWLIKTDPEGSVDWDKTFGGGGEDVGFSLAPGDDGTLAAGYTFGEEGQDVYLVKVGGQGEVIWNRTYVRDGDGAAFSAQLVDDGGYVLAGRQEGPEGDRDAMLMRLDRSGEVIWERNFGGSGEEVGISAVQTSEGGYVLTGRMTGQTRDGNGQDLLVIKTDPSGVGSWAMRLGGPGREIGTCVVETRDGYMVAGVTDSYGHGGEDLWLVKITDDLHRAAGDNLSASLPTPVGEGTPAYVPEPEGVGEEAKVAEEDADIYPPEEMATPEPAGAPSGTEDDLPEPSAPKRPAWAGEALMEESRSHLDRPIWDEGKMFREFFRM